MSRHTQAEWCKLKADLQLRAIDNSQTCGNNILCANDIIQIFKSNNFSEIANTFNDFATKAQIPDDSYPIEDVALMIDNLKVYIDQQVGLEVFNSIESQDNSFQRQVSKSKPYNYYNTYITSK